MPSPRALHSFPTRRSSDLLAVLAGGVGAALVAALVRVAAVPLEEQLHVFAPTKAANRSGVIRHLDVLVFCFEVRRANQTRRRLRSEEHTSELQSLRHLVCRPPEPCTLSLHDALPISWPCWPGA